MTLLDGLPEEDRERLARLMAGNALSSASALVRKWRFAMAECPDLAAGFPYWGECGGMDDPEYPSMRWWMRSPYAAAAKEGPRMVTLPSWMEEQLEALEQLAHTARAECPDVWTDYPSWMEDREICRIRAAWEQWWQRHGSW